MGFENLAYSSQKDSLVRKYLIPKRIIKSENTDFPENLLKDSHRQPSFSLKDNTIIHKDGWVLMDFGSEIQGGVDIVVQRAMEKRSRIRLVFGESVMEALSTVGEKNATNDHSVRDSVIEISSMSAARFGNTGFRFVKVESLDSDLYIRGIKGVFEYKDVEYLGSFECSDEMLNRVWNTAAYTVHINMLDYLIEGTKRDRLVWMGDLHPEISTVMAVFGYDESVPKSLDMVRDDTSLDNIESIEHPENLWMNTLPSYTCWWIKIHRDWYWQNGNIEYLNEQKDYMYKAVSLILSTISQEGDIDVRSFFVDWSSNYTESMKAGFRGCLVMSLKAAAEIFEIYGDPDMSKKCLDAIGLVSKKLESYAENKQMSAMVSLAGLADSKEISENIIKKDLLKGLSTFYGYYVLHALAKSGDTQAALDIMRNYWGAMLKLGATTFWEDFDIEWIENAAPIDEIVPEGKVDVHGDYGKYCYEKFRHSLSHGWASGPAPFMSLHILGIEILEPGCKKIKITPHLGDLSWAKGTYPTPYGVVTVEHKIVNGEVVTTVDAPKEVEIVR
ncbi:MAG: alpha-L-rhamnosidase [Clostridia bacterium]|nr:alpha-L-rhamnosidase [Clostridia bacterium]